MCLLGMFQLNKLQASTSSCYVPFDFHQIYLPIPFSFPFQCDTNSERNNKTTKKTIAIITIINQYSLRCSLSLLNLKKSLKCLPESKQKTNDKPSLPKLVNVLKTNYKKTRKRYISLARNVECLPIEQVNAIWCDNLLIIPMSSKHFVWLLVL